MHSYNGFTGLQRIRALRWLNAEYAAGRRSRPTECDACGQTTGIIEAHSEDYSEPHGAHIGGFAFCYTCHMMLHCRHKSPEAWERYRAAVREGATFAPFMNRNWYGFRARFLMARQLPAPASMRPPPARLVLDDEIRA